MFNMTGDDQSPKTLYVGNLSPHVTEDLLLALFSQIGECKSCKIIHEPGNDPYAFIEFTDSQSAAAALSAMNKRSCLGKEMKVNWATTSGGHQNKVDSSKHYHIFVGDLAPDIDQQTLREAFAPYGEISDVKIMKDPHTLVHKGYGFISFVNKVDAEAAIAQMNGQWLGTRKIRTNWATRKVQPGGNELQSSGGGGGSGGGGLAQGNKYANKLDYSEVWSRSSDSNTTVYVGGLSNISEEVLRNTFGMYGQITGIHPFPDRGYAFVRFATKEAACSAICGVHGMEINGSIAKCSWGKENIDMNAGGGVGVGGGGSQSSGSALGMGSSLYGNASSSAASLAALAAAQNVNSLSQLGGSSGASNPWNSATAAAQNSAAAQNTANWAAAANYQWAGYPQNTMNYWQGAYPGAAAYQNAAMMQGWGVMPTATAAGTTGSSAQYQLGQYQQGANGKS